jgi:phosphatidylinositol alpha-1,6-mannosyltransferase
MLPQSLVRKYHLAIGYPEDTEKLLSLNNNRVVVLGKLPQDELDYLIQRADLTIVPNIDVAGDVEGFGLVALEHSIKEKLVLAADIQGLKDAIIHNKNGIKLPPGDALSWAKSVTHWLQKVEESTNFGIKSRIFTIENYSWDKMGDGYLKEFNRLDGEK